MQTEDEKVLDDDEGGVVVMEMKRKKVDFGFT